MPGTPPRRFDVLLLAVVLWASAAGQAAAQQFRPEDRRVRNLTVKVIEEPYLIQAGTAREIYDALQARPEGWMYFEPIYDWRFRTRGGDLGSCSLTDFGVDVTMRVTYPRWEIPEGVEPGLLDDWNLFVGRMQERWDARVEEELELAVALERRYDRYERSAESCGAIQATLNADLREFRMERETRLETYRIGGGGEVTWPPGGGTVTVERSGAAEGELEARHSALYDYPALPASFQGATAQDFDQPAVRQAALVLGILRDGEILGTQSAGTDPDTGEAPPPDAVFPFPALAELMVAVLANALEVNGVLGLGAPIGEVLPDLPADVGAVTTAQLLAHRAGLHNGPGSLEGLLADGGDPALFTEPGAVFSFSRHSYTLAARVLEQVLGTSVEAALQAAILDPYGLADTSLGVEGADLSRLAPGVPDPTTALGRAIPADLPVVYTTVPDVLRLLAALGSEATLGVDVEARLEQSRAEGGSWAWDRGLWWNAEDGVHRALLVCGPRWAGVGAGFVLLPEEGTGVALWAADVWPHQTARWVLDSAVRGTEVARDPYLLPGPLEVSSMEVGSWIRCAYPPAVAGMTRRSREADGTAADAGWAGRYFNGPDAVGLVVGEEGLEVEGSEPRLAVRRLEGGDHVAEDEEGRYAVPLRLFRDGAGRAYLVVQGRAYLREGVEPRPSEGRGGDPDR